MDDRTRPILSSLEPSLPSRSYIDPEHYRRELEAIWYRSWLCIGRTEELAEPRHYKVVEVGSQSIVVTRDQEGRLHAFHNTCRHRGSVLCTEAGGRFRGNAIVCPYHGWTYSLAGELKGAPHQVRCPDFRTRDFPLYRVALDTWGGFVFVNLLGDAAPPFADQLEDLTGEVAHWSLEPLRVGRRIERTLACNWKIFWENYMECFHCPGVHPELCRIVPIFGRGLQAEDDDPSCPPELVGKGAAPLSPDAVTWTLDGKSELPELRGLDGADRERGHSLSTLLLEQDARVCELNQQGLHCLRHERGVLVPQEYLVRDFHRWVHSALGEAPPLDEQTAPR